MKSGFMIAWHQRKFTKNDGLWWYHFFLSVFFAGRTVYRGGLEAHRWPRCTTGTETRISGSWIGTRIWGASAGAMRRRFWEVGIVLFRCRIHMNEFFLAHGIEANSWQWFQRIKGIKPKARFSVPLTSAYDCTFSWILRILFEDQRMGLGKRCRPSKRKRNYHFFTRPWETFW